jgi:xanthine/CO dehydrogenase XdhC/CoxF family maturation factor
LNTPQEFAALLEGFHRLEQNGFAGGAALATLTRTQGSTFRRAGTRMLVGGGGWVVRGLSGGCPEADIIARAHEVIGSGEPRIVRYDREHGLDALIELGCGGELEVLIEPIIKRTDLAFVAAVECCLNARQPGFLATAFARDGRCLAHPRRLVWQGTVLHDEFADARLREAVIEQGRRHGGRPLVRSLESADGPLEVLIESLLPPYAAVLVGVNAASLALARIGCDLGWDVTVVDHRESREPPAGLPPQARLLPAAPQDLAGIKVLDRRCSAVVMTHNLERDIEYLSVLLTAPLGYLGAIGSRQRCARLLEACGASASRVHAPAGLNLGSETPEEIALAIAAEILAVNAGRQGGSLSAGSGPIH